MNSIISKSDTGYEKDKVRRQELGGDDFKFAKILNMVWYFLICI